MNEDITYALNLYTILSNKAPDNSLYALRLGKLYEIIGKDRYAKGNYYRACSISPNRPEPYFYLGSYFYSKKLYKRALKMCIKAYDNGYSTHYQTNVLLGNIYQKLGDSHNALKYFESAYGISQSEELNERINKLKSADLNNKWYYR